MKDYTYREMFDLETSHFWFIGKQLFISKILSTLQLKSPKILDIGSGTGGTTQILSKWGTVTGLEKNPHAASLARSRGLHIQSGSADHLPFETASFGLVTFFDVLYHKGLEEHQALTEAYRVLKPGGYLLITDCAMPSLWSPHDEVMDAKFRFTKRHLSTLISSSGFVVDMVRSIYAVLFPFFVLIRIKNRLFPSPSVISLPPKPINNLLITLLKIESYIFPIIRPPLGSSIMILAHKPV